MSRVTQKNNPADLRASPYLRRCLCNYGRLYPFIATRTSRDTTGNGTETNKVVVFKIRLPRIFAAILIGAILTVWRCNAVRPAQSAGLCSTLGVSQGAAFGAAVGFLSLAAAH